jgi:hypothetical protein
MKEQFQALEVAKLAALVGGQLKKVDSLTVDRHGLPANQINIDKFVTQVRNPNAQIQNNNPVTPQGFAPPVPEDLVQRLVPDLTQNIPDSAIAPQQNLALPVVTAPRQTSTQTSFNQDSKTLKKINTNLKNIKIVLDEILDVIKKK